jgi:integrase
LVSGRKAQAYFRGSITAIQGGKVPVKFKEDRWSVEGSECGERFHRVLPKGSKRSQAVDLEAKLRRDIFNAKELGHTPQIPLSNAIFKYLKEYKGKAKPHHANALAPYVSGKDLTDVVKVAELIRADVRVSNSTRNRRLAILKRVAALSYKRWDWLREPLHEKIEMLPENPARSVYLSRGEVARLLLNIPNRERRRAALALVFTGMRRSELCGLEPDDITGDAVCLTDTKTGSPRNIPILPSVRFVFRRLPFLFHPDTLSHDIQKASGGKFRCHDLRHTTASLLIQAGVPLYTVGAILGHSSVQTTRRYAHLDTKSMEQAISKLTPSRQIHRNPEQGIKLAK